MSKHTPEPWRITTHLCSRDTHIVRRIDGEKHAVCIIRTNNADEAEANAARIIACVNACAGMDDPAAEIERLRAESRSEEHTSNSSHIDRSV